MEKARHNRMLSLAVLLLLSALLMVLLSSSLGYSLLAPSPYNTYTLQALAWRNGRAYLEADIPHLELAIYNERYYVSFPPVPSLPIYVLTFLFEDNVPDTLLVMLYALLAVFLLWKLFSSNSFKPWVSALMAFLLTFASSMLPMTLTGAVWYQAQVLAFLLTVASIERMDADKPTWGLLLFALAVGCRPFNVVYGPLLIILYLFKCEKGVFQKDTIKKLLPGILVGLCIAALYAMYNKMRFDNPLEFGHNQLPEFSFQGGTQFSFMHLEKNISQFAFSWPFERVGDGYALKKFGFSLFLANPVLLLMLLCALVFGKKRKLKPQHGFIVLFFFIHLILLLLHRTFGGYQYGARYAVDLIPYAILFGLLENNKKPHWPAVALLVAGLVVSIYGSLNIHL